MKNLQTREKETGIINPLRNSDINKQDISVLICLYTCANHEPLHREFHLSPIGKFIQSIKGSVLVNVFADGTLAASKILKDNLYVDTQEAYTNLSVKTFKMIKSCVNHYHFRYLMKIDLSSGIEQLNLNKEVENRVSDQTVMVKYLTEANSELQERKLGDYSGWKAINAQRAGVEQWAKRCGLHIAFNRVFTDERIPPYYSGKCYFLSRAFASYIADNGSVMAREHALHLGGSEDLMIGRLYDEYVSKYSSV